MPASPPRPTRRSLRLALGLWAALRWAPAGATDPLRGEYGFLTEFDGISEAEARSRVRKMWDTFRVLEFQFYDAFEGYSHPPAPLQEVWNSSFGRPVRRSVLKAYTSEIEVLGGRSWFYVQAMGTDPNDTLVQYGHSVIGQHLVDGQPLLDIVAPTAAWGRQITPNWAVFAKSLGFSGIHWDTLGQRHGVVDAAGGDLPAFLRASQPLLQRHGLAQTANFVDGFGWDPTLFKDVGWAGNVVSFPYWEAWSLPEAEDAFFNEVAPRGGGVFVCYPGRSADHSGEDWNRNAKGIWPVDLLIKRWLKARCHGSTYLAIGDGHRHLQDEYFPDSVSINAQDAVKIRDEVFKACSFRPTACAQQPAGSPWAWVACGVLTVACFVLGRLSASHGPCAGGGSAVQPLDGRAKPDPLAKAQRDSYAPALAGEALLQPRAGWSRGSSGSERGSSASAPASPRGAS